MASVYALILAGGEGTRFAPLSTPEKPKQFLPLVGEDSLIRQTAARIQSVISSEDWWVATNAKYCELVKSHLSEMNPDHIIGETKKKNTAPAIALAAAALNRMDPESIMVILPSDHVILDNTGFIITLQKAIDTAAGSDSLVTLGITPTWPSSDYGYIEQGEDLGGGVFRVSRFVEKPDHETARQYLDAKRFVWNSGMFVWQTRSILDEMRKHLPVVYQLLQSLQWGAQLPTPKEIGRFFKEVDSVSIDYGVMEKSHRCLVIPAEFGWNDVGTWESLKMLVDSGTVHIGNEVRDHLRKQTLS